MARRPEIGNVALYPDRPLNKKDKNGYVLKFYCPIEGKRIRRNCGTRDRREARKILRECRERLLDGSYVESNGAITQVVAKAAESVSTMPQLAAIGSGSPSWQECYDKYCSHHKKRVRPRTHDDAVVGLGLAERIFESHREDLGLSEGLAITETLTLANLEFLQDCLLAGEQSRYDVRSPNTVNSVLAVVMPFARFCHRRGWIEQVPPLQKINADEVMKGRPITEDEFERMLEVVPEVVGEGPTESWRFALKILWESGFRVGDLMNFSWDDTRRIHPVWPNREDRHPTIIVASTQKNKRVQEIPLLPGLDDLLQTVPETDRTGWVADPLVTEGNLKRSDSFRPRDADLRKLASRYSNVAIGKACGVSEAAVRKWFREINCVRDGSANGIAIPDELTSKLRRHGRPAGDHPSLRREVARLSSEQVGKVIVEIGRVSGVVVQQADPETGQRLKYASAHDIRRGCAERLVNMGVSAETLKVVMRHASFATTEKFYGATRSAQAAASELRQRVAECTKSELVGGLVGGPNETTSLDPSEVAKLKALIARL